MIKLDGAKLAAQCRNELKERNARLENQGIRAGLTAIRVGSDPASELYVSRKIKACEEVGISSRNLVLEDDVSEEELLEAIDRENRAEETSGILVQLTLPQHIDTQKVLERVAPSKDIDGFHPFNVGRVATAVGGFAPCTPKGVMRLLEEYDIECRGADAVIVGASNIVGRPLAGLMLAAGATVTVCHVDTRDLLSHTCRADILAVGVGQAGMITRDMVKPGAVLIDVGINRVPAPDNPRGFRVIGDIAEDALELCKAYTPVPGGVGPMTVAMLIENTLIAAEALSQGYTV